MKLNPVTLLVSVLFLAPAARGGWSAAARYDAERPTLRQADGEAVHIAFRRTTGWSLAMLELGPHKADLTRDGTVVLRFRAARPEDVGAKLRISYKRANGKRTWLSPWPALSAEWDDVHVPVVGDPNDADCITLAPARREGNMHLLAGPARFEAPVSAAPNAWPHPPITVSEDRPTPPLSRRWRAPNLPELPTRERLDTTVVRGRALQVTGVYADANGAPGLKLHSADDKALYFTGTGGGLRSRERLIVEDCTFTLDFREGDFAKWDARRCGLFVQGYREVIVRRCRFVSKGERGDPPRRTNASITAYDCLHVQVEDCTFTGMTNWMRGHVTVFCCGPTRIRRIEVTGVKDDRGWLCGGGIWIANGLGEGKIGTIHADRPELMLYPSGPAIVEDCTIRRQTGRDNTDGIYIQSIHNYVVRRCTVSDWGKDALLDVGFRDTSVRHWRGRRLANHGAMGLIEDCTLAEGLVKDSVGAGGGLIFRNNRLRNVWLMPYIFDGGGWWIVGNTFDAQRVPVLSGYDEADRGWAPLMFDNGSKAYVYNNVIRTDPQDPPEAIYIANGGTREGKTALADCIRADGNLYDLAGKPKQFAIDRSEGAVYDTFAAWREATGNDWRSTTDPNAKRPSVAVELPGGIAP